MSKVTIARMDALPLEAIQPLLVEARAEGFRFLDWLIDDYQSGSNQFALPGEALFGGYHGPRLVAVGGLNRDPYAPVASAGRVRRVYVLSAWRRQGVGRQLVEAIIAEARHSFTLLTLRTPDESASRFYSSLGFHTSPAVPGATHHLVLAP